MAFVAGPTTISVSFQDDDLATSTQTLHVPDNTSIADAQSFAASYISLVGPVSDCAVRKYTVNQEFYDDSFPEADEGSDVENKGVLTFRTEGNGSSTISWPGVLESVLQNTVSRPGVFIDLDKVRVAALVSGLLSGLSGVQPSTRRGDDLIAVKEAYKQNRRSQKSMGYKG